jgi:hypothetical protein
LPFIAHNSSILCCCVGSGGETLEFKVVAQRKVIKSQTIFAETPLATSKVVLLSHCTLFLHFLQGVPVKKREKYRVIPAKAGIHTAQAEATTPWIAACAAMTPGGGVTSPAFSRTGFYRCAIQSAAAYLSD